MSIAATAFSASLALSGHAGAEDADNTRDAVNVRADAFGGYALNPDSVGVGFRATLTLARFSVGFDLLHQIGRDASDTDRGESGMPEPARSGLTAYQLTAGRDLFTLGPTLFEVAVTGGLARVRHILCTATQCTDGATLTAPIGGALRWSIPAAPVAVGLEARSSFLPSERDTVSTLLVFVRITTARDGTVHGFAPPQRVGQ